MEKWLILGLGKETQYTRQPGVSVVPEIKKMLKQTQWWEPVKGIQEATERAHIGQCRNNLRNNPKAYRIITPSVRQISMNP